jgi:LmbE family N-acetylglucosaminyl deacetylase
VAANITYTRRTPERLLTTSKIGELFADWRGADECWMFVAPHDDDTVIGAGLTLQVGLAEGAKVHAMIVTDGAMGYCRVEHRHDISKIRAAEAKKAYQILGLPPDRLRFAGYPDGSLSSVCGRRFATAGATTAIEGGDGLENSLTHALRQIRPNRVFLATSADLHPDHKIVHEELLISLFHAQGAIWPELGTPIAEVPKVYEYAVYCDFPEPPQIRIETPPAMLDAKIQAILASASQEQIGEMVETQRNGGPIEYLRELDFHFYSPANYQSLFKRTS